MSKQEVVIDGIVYVPKSEVPQKTGMPYCIVRTYSAGVFAGYVESRTGKEVVMRDARRLWYWDGAASLSQLAMEGVSKPGNCKFPIAIGSVTLTETIEIILATEAAKKSIDGVPVWKM